MLGTFSIYKSVETTANPFDDAKKGHLAFNSFI